MSKPGSDYYKGGFRYVVDGAPCRFPRELSKHALALIRSGDFGLSFTGSQLRGQQSTLRTLADTRYPQTQYVLFPPKEEALKEIAA